MNDMNTATRLPATAGALVLAAAGLLGPAPVAAATTPACTNVDLTASYHHSDAGAGHSYGWIVLRNTSGHACHTGGYGGVSYVGDGNGTQIGAPAVRLPGMGATDVLAPGQRLRSSLAEVPALNFPRKGCHRHHVDGFRVYVPNATAPQYVVHPTTGCRNHHVKLIHQKPYRRP